MVTITVWQTAKALCHSPVLLSAVLYLSSGKWLPGARHGKMDSVSLDSEKCVIVVSYLYLSKDNSQLRKVSINAKMFIHDYIHVMQYYHNQHTLCLRYWTIGYVPLLLFSHGMLVIVHINAVSQCLLCPLRALLWLCCSSLACSVVIFFRNDFGLFILLMFTLCTHLPLVFSFNLESPDYDSIIKYYRFFYPSVFSIRIHLIQFPFRSFNQILEHGCRALCRLLELLNSNLSKPCLHGHNFFVHRYCYAETGLSLVSVPSWDHWCTGVPLTSGHLQWSNQWPQGYCEHFLRCFATVRTSFVNQNFVLSFYFKYK